MKETQGSQLILNNIYQGIGKQMTKVLARHGQYIQDTENSINEIGFVDGVIVQPKPFATRFQPRFGDEAPLKDVMAQCREGL
jgi:hypothetical protein